MPFTPALGRPELTGWYDAAIRVLARERAWRYALLKQVAPRDGEIILDVGCGTGTFAIMLKKAAPGAHIIGLDPDHHVLAIAADKAARAGATIDWRHGSASDAAQLEGTVDKAVSSLVFHQVPVSAKCAGIAAMFEAVRSGGEVHIADYATQPTGLMRMLFRMTVQMLDGIADTGANANGALERILREHQGADARSAQVFRAATGAISLFQADKRP
ncbi:class I SAM-dependent methyltransferase [Sphingomonas parva]|uniref:Class I SAM-dependent methyltransferase n=1 Tax=Sphingomonas parva TaxID=2555898 RepID=A0A4Y8ZUS6_9SPHN|nr:class I SAM-dependent methyltransferase [Sphingomonas parva]TFI59768.1 class I SAM-dependent methyltransferase [Sphingomonas parva]